MGWPPQSGGPVSAEIQSGGCNSMVEYLPSKQATWVRFPSPALGTRHDGRVHRGLEGQGRARSELRINRFDAAVAQLVERVLGKDEVLGSNPSGSFHGSVRRRHETAGDAVGPAVGPPPPDADRVDVWDGRAGFPSDGPMDIRDAARQGVEQQAAATGRY
jgi:hypothetical protein